MLLSSKYSHINTLLSKRILELSRIFVLHYLLFCLRALQVACGALQGMTFVVLAKSLSENIMRDCIVFAA